MERLSASGVLSGVPFRDDQDALRARNEAMEAELEELRGALDRARSALDRHEKKDVQDESELARLRDAVAKLERKTSARPRPPSPTAPGSRVGLAIGGVLIASFSAYFLTRGASSASGPATAPTASAAPTTSSVPPRATSPLDVAIFAAEVVSSEHARLEVGTGCAIEVDLGPGPRPRRTRIYCGDELVYDTTMQVGASMTLTSDEVVEYTTPDARFDYRASVSDTGTRTGERPQLVLDTQVHLARIWRENLEPFEVRLYVHDRSLGVPGPGLSASPRHESDVPPLHVAATLGEHDGTPPEAIDACEVRVHPASGAPNARVNVRCGADYILYGAGTTGFAQGTLDPSGALASVDDERDDDHDPVMHLRALERTLEVRMPSWSVSYALTDDARCNLDGRWSGRARTSAGESSVALASEIGSDEAVLSADAIPAGHARIQRDCARGEIAIVLDDGTRYAGELGPGFATFVAHRTDGGDDALLWLARSGPRPSE